MRQPRPARFAPLLGALVLLVLLSEPLAAWQYGRAAGAVLYPIVLAGLMLAVGRSGRAGRIAMALWLGTIALELAVRASAGTVLTLVGRVADATFVFFGIGILIREILRRGAAVSLDTLLGGIAVYLMIGFFYTICFSAIEFVQPGSFYDRGTALSDLSGQIAVSSGEQARYPGLVYYSFVTLTTLGYGDIVPTQPLARALAASEALLGQIYLTVLVAALVGMHLSQRVHGTGDHGGS